MINDSPNLPWTNLGISCNRISTYPSPVISFEIDFHLSSFLPPTVKLVKETIHIMLDSGASVSFLTHAICKVLGFAKYIKPAGQLALQADGKTQLQVLGEIHMIVTRTTSKGETVNMPFKGLVVDKLNNCDAIGGMNFLVEMKLIY